MNIRELLKRDHGIDIQISRGIGRRHDPYVVDQCSAADCALTQVRLLRGLGRGLGELWRIIEWKGCDFGSATEIIYIEAIRFTPEQIETVTRSIYFDTRAVTGTPHSLHPLTSWRGPPGSPRLPYEMGWLHFDKVVNGDSSSETFDQTILYSGVSAKASIYVYERPVGGDGATRDAELERVSAIILNPKLEDPWPKVEMGPFAMKFFLSDSNMTAVGVAVSGQYFIKARLTYLDDLKMRGMMNFTLKALGDCVLRHAASRR